MRRYLPAICATIFMTFWIYGFSTSLYGGRCHKSRIPPEDRVTICRNARWLNGWLMTDPQLRGFFHSEGMALVELGRDAEAAAAFAEAARLTRAR